MKGAIFSQAGTALVFATVATLTTAVPAAEPAPAAAPVLATAPVAPVVATPAPVATEPNANAPVTIAFEAGVYKCELGRSVNIKGITADRNSVSLEFGRHDYTMLAVSTRSGALRFEDSASGLVWIVIPAKAMLLDTSKGKQLANECRL